jgi:hypothetical protein
MELDQAARERENAVRRRIVRTALLTTPIFVITAGAWVFFLWDRVTGPEYGSTIFLLVVIGIFASLFGVQSVAALRDLFGHPHELEGLVTRKWTKRDSFVWKSYYIRMERKILRGDEDLLSKVRPGDLVQIRYFPHSALLVAVNRLEKPEPEPETETPQEEAPARPAKARGRAERPRF